MGKTRTLDDTHEQQQNAKLPYKVDADADTSTSTSTFTSGQQKLAQNADLELDLETTKTKTKSSVSNNKNENNSDGDKENDEDYPVPTALVTHATLSTLVSNAVTVETENIAVAVAVEDGDGNNDGSDNRGSPTTRNNKQMMALSFLISVLMSVALIVFFNLRDRQEPQSSSNIATRDSDSKNNGSENSSGTTPEEDNLQYTTEYLERQSALIKILTPLVGDPRVFDPESPLASSDRIAALERLVVNPLDFPIPVGDEKHVSNDNDTAATFEFEFEFEPTTTTTLFFEDQVHKFRQHFVMTLFYYATNGETWENQYWFLTGPDECQWNSVRSFVEDDNEFAPSVVSTTGIFCNEDGWVSHMTMYWNNLSGTLPSELSYFEDTLIEINLTGGSISGTIPESFEKLNNLATFGIGEHCLTGTIPERLEEIPSLKLLAIYNNAGLSGSLNKMCDGIRRPEGTHLSADNCNMDDSTRSTECDCCTCCDPAKFECSDRVHGTHSFLYTDVTSTNDYIKGFEKPCLSPEQKEWILEECPCIRSYITDWGSPSNYCTNCTEDGARPSHPPFLPVENNRRHIRH